MSYDEASDAELARWPGVTASRTVGGKHACLVLEFDGKTRKVFYPVSPSDAYRGQKNHITNIRHTLRAMGAVRTEAPASNGHKRERRRTRSESATPVADSHPEHGPLRDPWAALKMT